MKPTQPKTFERHEMVERSPSPLPRGEGRGEGSFSLTTAISAKSWLRSFQALKLIFFLSLGITPPAWAHDPGLSSALIDLRRDRMEVTLTIAKKDAELLISSAAELESDWPTNTVDREVLAKLVGSQFRIECDHQNGILQGLTLRSEDQNNTTVFWSIPCEQCSSLKVESSLLKYLPPGHRQYLSVRVAERQPIAERLLSAQDLLVEIAIPQAIRSETALTSSAISFLQLGIKHILTGYDHLLFLFGLLIVTRRFSSALRIITCFTVAHSITLALATLSPVPAPPRLVEPLIAASIVYVGLENLARGGEPKGRWLLTFAFGLIHGCGFASALRELGIGAGGRGVALPLICFNSGVELGQLMIALLLLPLIWKAQARPAFVQRFVPACSGVVVLLGAYWLVQRLWTS